MTLDVDELLRQRQFMTAGGTETYLLFQQGFAMREFCAFEVFEHEDALAAMEENYLTPILDSVAANGHALLLDALLWRAHPDYIEALGYAPSDLKRVNALALDRTRAAVDAWRRRSSKDESDFPVLVVADIGPRGDGYQVGDQAPTVAGARDYHRAQMEALADAGADVVSAWTMTSANEATGVARAAAELNVPVIISATVETDGRLPDGSTLGDFIRRIDDATSGLPTFYAVNCAHPTHLRPTLDAAADRGESWLERFKGFRANSSKMSHEELDNSTELDRGDPDALSREVADMQAAFSLKVVGGCCGTDMEHIAKIARATSRRTVTH